MKINYFLGIVFIGSIISGCSPNLPTPQSKPLKSAMQATKNFNDRDQVELTVNNKKIQVEVVNTEQSTALGLSGRESIGAEGMLFIFPNTQVRHFWMKEMLFPIDIIWIHQQKVVGITENVPFPSPGTPISQLPKYRSPESVEMVLEVPAGFAQQNNLTVGMTISLE